MISIEIQLILNFLTKLDVGSERATTRDGSRTQKPSFDFDAEVILKNADIK